MVEKNEDDMNMETVEEKIMKEDSDVDIRMKEEEELRILTEENEGLNIEDMSSFQMFTDGDVSEEELEELLKVAENEKLMRESELALTEAYWRRRKQKNRDLEEYEGDGREITMAEKVEIATAGLDVLEQDEALARDLAEAEFDKKKMELQLVRRHLKLMENEFKHIQKLGNAPPTADTVEVFMKESIVSLDKALAKLEFENTELENSIAKTEKLLATCVSEKQELLYVDFNEEHIKNEKLSHRLVRVNSVFKDAKQQYQNMNKKKCKITKKLEELGESIKKREEIEMKERIGKEKMEALREREETNNAMRNMENVEEFQRISYPIREHMEQECKLRELQIEEKKYERKLKMYEAMLRRGGRRV